MSAVLVPAPATIGAVIEHPWISAARRDARPDADVAAEARWRAVPSAAGLEVLRARGKSAFVAMLAGALPELPYDPQAWRLVDELDHPRADADDRVNRPRVQAVTHPADDAVEARLLVPYDMRVFEGHFAAIPLVPGMLQVAWAIELAHEHLTGVGTFRGIAAAKFRCLVRPGMALQLSLQWLAAKRELRFEYHHDTTIVAGGRLRMAGVDV